MKQLPFQRMNNNAAQLPDSRFFPDAQDGLNHKGTNQWDTNLRLNIDGTDATQGVAPVAPMPYTVSTNNQGLIVCMPMQIPQDEQKSSTLITPHMRNIQMSASEFSQSSPLNRKVVESSDFVTTIQWTSSKHAQQTMQSPIARGMPYASVRYAGLTPTVFTENAILGVNNRGGDIQGQAFSGTKFKVALNNGQTWIIYAETPITLKCLLSADGAWSLAAQQPYSGWLRVAVLDYPLSPTGQTQHNNETLLDTYSAVIPVAGSATQSVTQFGSDAVTVTTEFDWTVTRFAGTQNTTELMTMALPHHIATAVNPKKAALSMPSIKGLTQAVIGDQLKLVQNSERPSQFMVQDIRQIPVQYLAEMIVTLAQEQLKLPKNDEPTDPYNYGKSVARAARLIQLAFEFEQVELATQWLSELKANLENCVLGKNKVPLVYDVDWGGIASTVALNDAGADYGAGCYNDHHFHYGYFLNAAAVIAEHDPSWMNRWIPGTTAQYKDWFNALYDDIGALEATEHFPKRRYLDPFDGHSWASGLFAFGDSKNQESTSEAVNAWMGAWRYSSHMGDSARAQAALAAFVSEVQAAKYYWQITPSRPIYNADFVKNIVAPVIGIVWGLKATTATWFEQGQTHEALYGIQMFPAQPYLTQLLDSDWLAEIKATLRAIVDDHSAMANWRLIALKALALATTDAHELDALWQKARLFQAYQVDLGDSLANTLAIVGGRIAQVKQMRDQSASKLKHGLFKSRHDCQPTVMQNSKAKVDAPPTLHLRLTLKGVPSP